MHRGDADADGIAAWVCSSRRKCCRAGSESSIMGVFYSPGPEAQPKDCRHARLRRPRFAPLPPAQGFRTPAGGRQRARAIGGLAGLELVEDGAAIERSFRFDDYHRTMAFVNALAYVAHREDHHPDLGVHYNRVVVRYSTHDVGGLSENDLICAAKASALYE
jgi:4a-hydroxytetrahydrobiopterin dehydratase